MIAVKELNVAPVKSTALVQPAEVYVTKQGIVEDRRFYIIDAQGKLVTRGKVGELTLLRTDYCPDPERLAIHFPDGLVIQEALELWEPVQTTVWQHQSSGRVLGGTWNTLLSEFLGQPVRLVRSDLPGQGNYINPISILSQESVDELNRRAANYGRFEAARFRANLVLDGCTPHEEDQWVGRRLRLGETLIIRVAARDWRCVTTTINPKTGKRDADTLRAIASYRPPVGTPPEGKIFFGVSATVEEPGLLHVGDRIELL